MVFGSNSEAWALRLVVFALLGGMLALAEGGTLMNSLVHGDSVDCPYFGIGTLSAVLIQKSRCGLRQWLV